MEVDGCGTSEAKKQDRRRRLKAESRKRNSFEDFIIRASERNPLLELIGFSAAKNRSCDLLIARGPVLSKVHEKHPSVLDDILFMLTQLSSEEPEGWAFIAQMLHEGKTGLETLLLLKKKKANCPERPGKSAEKKRQKRVAMQQPGLHPLPDSPTSLELQHEHLPLDTPFTTHIDHHTETGLQQQQPPALSSAQLTSPGMQQQPPALSSALLTSPGQQQQQQQHPSLSSALLISPGLQQETPALSSALLSSPGLQMETPALPSALLTSPGLQQQHQQPPALPSALLTSPRLQQQQQQQPPALPSALLTSPRLQQQQQQPPALPSALLTSPRLQQQQQQPPALSSALLTSPRLQQQQQQPPALPSALLTSPRLQQQQQQPPALPSALLTSPRLQQQQQQPPALPSALLTSPGLQQQPPLPLHTGLHSGLTTIQDVLSLGKGALQKRAMAALRQFQANQQDLNNRQLMTALYQQSATILSPSEKNVAWYKNFHKAVLSFRSVPCHTP